MARVGYSSSRHLLDPELAQGLARLPPFSELSKDTLPALRAALQGASKTLIDTTATDDLKFSMLYTSGSADRPAVRLAVYEPKKRVSPAPVLLHIHGGGFVLGTPEMRHVNSIRFAQRLGCVVVSVDYRLAPEHPFPAAVEDCYAALTWLNQNAEYLGVDPRRIAISGESAGGGIAAGLALLARDRGEFAVCFQLLAYPMLNDRNAENTNPFIGEFVWTVENNRFGWSSLLGASDRSVSPYASASRAENLTGLPPAFIGVGALDLFVNDNIDYAQRLVAAGIPTEFHLYPGAFHAFDLIADAEVSTAFQRDREQALRRAFSAPQGET